MRIGLSGTNAAGKGSVADHLRGRGFLVRSLSDAIRDELRARGEVESRKRMIEAGTRLRAESGPGALALRTLPHLRDAADAAIDSIRHPAEVRALREAAPEFVLLWIDAPIELRFARMRERARPGDPENVEELRRLEGLELASDREGGQQLLAVRDLAAHVLVNDGSFDDLFVRVDSILAELESPSPPPR